ncbi:mannose-1-phosphate guanylyltransferase/mannose-6-phosphate isomerase [Hokovirus HKV1]|mgnify:CR=1 FL=1|uniref:Mannose-1-phosphate guanylyltransferase/mannose-6-phosphate isomerase n=1 Tax=Hokovirus HKV1 TaxID=1977638 RepID=A0A1V0SH58_9VIRU|nr:mannose-1-phosphate guanylyltransferase/mannose-6-phosphate isomerase [Hokovirus HKV1]
MVKVALVMCGGIGSRLWPLSTNDNPKQFLNLFNNNTLLHNTINRIPQDIEIFIVTNIKYKHYIENNYPNYNVIYETERKNTGTAIILCVHYLINNLHYDPINTDIIVLPADHYMEKEEFINCLNIGFTDILNQSIITFGIKPTYPEVGYGYINPDKTNEKIKKIINFVEKPNLYQACKFIDSGYLWNSGIFIFNLNTILLEYEFYANTLFNNAKITIMNTKDNIFASINDIEHQFDKIIMEKTRLGKVIEFNGLWSDIGDWSRIYDINNKDENNNVIQNKNSCNLLNVNNSLINIDYGNLIGINLNDLVIIKKDSNILISDRKSCDNIKLFTIDKNVSRPWGYYNILHESDDCKVKKIFVYPNKRLSYQYHKYRSEKWTIISGSGIITLDDNKINVNAGDMISIEKLQKHRIENIGNDVLIFIETQLGTYFGEDDIIRLDDDYGRTE